jgi:hypothetical protein
MSLNIWSDGMGSWSYGFLKPLLARTFPGTTITYDDRKERKPDLVVRSHFQDHERAPPYSCPYITWSGESYPVAIRAGEPAPLLEINTAHTGRPNEIWFPHLVAELEQTVRPDPVGWPKKHCCAFAFGNRVPQREELFLRMRAQEPTCHAFGRSCFTPGNPFVLGRADRSRNDEMFHQHGYGLVVAMENKIAPGYLTEKIGYAFKAGAVPIYWGDTATVSDLFNPAAFINVCDFASPTAAANYAVQVWRDPHKLRPYLDAPMTLNGRLADYEAVRTEYRPWQKPFVDRLRAAFPDLS